MKLLNLGGNNFTALKLKNFNDEINSFFMGQLLQQNLELREAHQESFSEMEELKKFQSSHLRHYCFQDAESIRSEISHVTSRPVSFHLIQFLKEC